MKVAIIGSREINVENIGEFVPENTTELVSGGAKGVDTCVREYALRKNIKLTEFLPDYKRYSKGAPLKRNIEIIEYSDLVIALWNGKSRGTKYVIEQCKKRGKEVKVYTFEQEH